LWWRLSPIPASDYDWRRFTDCDRISIDLNVELRDSDAILIINGNSIIGASFAGSMHLLIYLQIPIQTSSLPFTGACQPG
jgi:hypothetical protein